MPAVTVHGVTISWSLAPGVRDLLSGPFSSFPTAPAPRQDVAPAPSVHIHVRPAAESAGHDPRAEGWRPVARYGAIETFGGPDGFLIWDQLSRALIGPGDAPIDVAIVPGDREADIESASQVLLVAMALGLRRVGLFHLHAAALVLPSGTPVVVAGGSGAGKTTTSLALLEADSQTQYLGDDSLYLTSQDGGLRVVAFSRDFHLSEKALAAFPRLERFAGPAPSYSPKRPVDPRGAYPGRFLRAVSLASPARGLALFPSVTAAEVTSVVPIDRADAFGRLLGSSGGLVVEGVPGREENVAALKELLHAVRCYEVRLGADALRDRARAVAERVEEVRH